MRSSSGGSVRPAHILPTIVLAQFAGTSLWFASNAVLTDARHAWGLEAGALGWLTSAVQLGFIVGTLLFALLNVADRLPPRAVFLGSALLAAAANAGVALGLQGLLAIGGARFLVGFFLAGIYPVGMKIAASWYAEGLGRALGMLVGALVLGTAFPHLLKAGGADLAWRDVVLGVSGLAATGGVALYALVPAGPHLPAKGAFDPRALGRIFREPDFRAAALGYFGHMWELYAFWTLVPAIIAAMAAGRGALDVSLWSFLVIGIGALGCAGGGFVSQRAGSGRVAAATLSTSALCCLLAPVLLRLPLWLSLPVLLLWGAAVVTDSPQLSALNANTAPRQLVGTALTITTCIGFAITIPAIQLSAWLFEAVRPEVALLVLAPGPILGRLALRRLLAKH